MEEIEFKLDPEFCIHKWMTYKDLVMRNTCRCVYCGVEGVITGFGEVHILKTPRITDPKEAMNAIGNSIDKIIKQGDEV